MCRHCNDYMEVRGKVTHGAATEKSSDAAIFLAIDLNCQTATLTARGMAQASLSTASQSHLLQTAAALVLPCTSRSQ